MMLPRHNRSNALRNLHAFVTSAIIVLNSGFALTVGISATLLVINIFYLLVESTLHGIRFRKSQKTTVLIAIIMLFTISLIVNFDYISINEYIRIIVLLFCAYHITEIYQCGELIMGYCILMRLIAVVSVAFYFLIILFPRLPYITVTNQAGVSYYTCLLGNVNSSIINVSFIRNSGVFWEGGMYAGLATLWLIFEIVCIERTRKTLIIMCIGFLAIYSTKSTSGYMYMIMLILLFISYSTQSKRKPWQSILLLLSFIAVIVVGFRYQDIIGVLAEKDKMIFGKLQSQNASYTDRIYGPLTDLYVSIINPLGIGLTRLTQYTRDVSYSLFGNALTSRTSSLTFFFAAFGPICGILVNLQWVKLFNSLLTSKCDKVLVLILFFVMATSTPLQYTLILLILIFEGTTARRNQRERCESTTLERNICRYRNVQVD